MDKSNTVPDWFKLISAWREKSPSGEHGGLTLPYLASALAWKNERRDAEREDVENLLNDIITTPVEDYVFHIKLCSELNYPVINYYERDSVFRAYERGTEIERPKTTETSLEIEDSIAGYLEVPAVSQSLIEALLDMAEESLKHGMQSRIKINGEYQNAPLQREDIMFIEDTLGV